MRAAALALLLTGCTAAQVDEGAHVFSAVSPLLGLIPGAGPACAIAAKVACAAVEEISAWPDGAGIAPAAKQ